MPDHENKVLVVTKSKYGGMDIKIGRTIMTARGRVWSLNGCQNVIGWRELPSAPIMEMEDMLV